MAGSSGCIAPARTPNSLPCCHHDDSLNSLARDTIDDDPSLGEKGRKTRHSTANTFHNLLRTYDEYHTLLNTVGVHNSMYDLKYTYRITVASPHVSKRRVVNGPRLYHSSTQEKGCWVKWIYWFRHFIALSHCAESVFVVLIVPYIVSHVISVWYHTRFTPGTNRGNWLK